jgi:hypothetical protein
MTDKKESKQQQEEEDENTNTNVNVNEPESLGGGVNQPTVGTVEVQRGKRKGDVTATDVKRLSPESLQEESAMYTESLRRLRESKSPFYQGDKISAENSILIQQGKKFITFEGTVTDKDAALESHRNYMNQVNEGNTPELKRTFKRSNERKSEK